MDKGYLDDIQGRILEPVPATFAMAQIKYLSLPDAGVFEPVKDFAFWGDVKWDSAAPVRSPEFSGCGIAFRVGDNAVDAYYAMLTNDSFLVDWCFASLGNRCGRVGRLAERER